MLILLRCYIVFMKEKLRVLLGFPGALQAYAHAWREQHQHCFTCQSHTQVVAVSGFGSLSTLSPLEIPRPAD